MAWIKLETHTFDKVEVFSMAQELGIDPDSVVGKCCRVWAWFDANTTDGITKSVTTALLDRYCGITGFSQAMVNVGWMVIEDGDLLLPNYDRHNSQTAKDRALNAKRVAKSKKKALDNAEGNGLGNGKSNAKSLPKSLDREDKRREDKNINTPEGVSSDLWSDFLAYRKRLKAPVTDRVVARLIKESKDANMTLEQVLETIIFKGWRSFEASWIKSDVQQVEKVKFL
jgi:hypothetical protein